eukprot:gene18171-19985_t
MLFFDGPQIASGFQVDVFAEKIHGEFLPPEKTTRWSDSAKDKDPVGNSGYETVVKRLKDGKKMCDDFSEFLKQRAKLEDDYGRNMIRIAQQSMGNDEIGTLRDSWDKVKAETEKIGMQHCDLARKLDDADKTVKGFRDEQKNERAKIDEKMKRLQREKKSAFENVVKCKKQYEQRCKELDSATEMLESISHYTPKEEEKLRNKKLKAKTAQENSDQQYQSAVKTADQCHAMWESEMEMCCEQFQSFEEERIRFLRNEMWLCSNFGSQLCVNVDQMYEEVRLQLEKCDEARDITQFIHSKQTGSEKPVPLKYVNYYHPQTAVVTANEIPKPKHTSLPRPAPALKPMPHAYSNLPASPIGQKLIQNEDSDYAIIGEMKPESGERKYRKDASNRFVRASYDYQAQGPEEIDMKQDDILEILAFEGSEWCIGRNQRTGESGAFPKAFIQKC